MWFFLFYLILKCFKKKGHKPWLLCPWQVVYFTAFPLKEGKDSPFGKNLVLHMEAALFRLLHTSFFFCKSNNYFYKTALNWTARCSKQSSFKHFALQSVLASQVLLGNVVQRCTRLCAHGLPTPLPRLSRELRRVMPVTGSSLPRPVSPRERGREAALQHHRTHLRTRAGVWVNQSGIGPASRLTSPGEAWACTADTSWVLRCLMAYCFLLLQLR